MVQQYATVLKDVFKREMTPENMQRVYSNMINIYANAVTFHDYTYRNHELYVAPFIYENIPVTDESFYIPRNEDGFWSQMDFDKKHAELFIKQMQYAEKAAECSGCSNLATCTSRHILSYMESRGIKKCIVPKDLLREPGKNANALAQCVCET